MKRPLLVFFLLCSIFLGLLTSPTGLKILFNQILPSMGPQFIGLTPHSVTDEERAAAFKYEDLPDLTGHVSIVTGANTGIGYWTAYHLAKKGSVVVMGCRNHTKCQDAAANIRKELPNVEIHPLTVDTSSLKSVTTFTQEFRQKFKRLDHLVLNTAIGFAPEGQPLSEDGIAVIFATNHLGHFKLFQGVSDIMETTASTYGVSTVVAVASSAHYKVTQVPSSVEDVTSVSKPISYLQSKLCNILFAREVADRMKAKGVNVLANAVNPGFAATQIFDPRGDSLHNYSPFLGHLFKFGVKVLQAALFWDPEEGALTQVFAAASTTVTNEKLSGRYFQPIARESPPHPTLATKENQVKLWELSEQLVKKWQK